MKDLHDLDIKSRLPQFIDGFLSKRKFRDCVDSTLSDVKNQEEGIPQGSILSITLFNIKINNVIKELPSGIDGSLYVDDLMICFKSKYIHTIERNLLQGRKKISRWATVMDSGTLKQKTKCVHFCHKNKLHNDPSIKLDGSEIPVVDEYKFLGIISEKKITFISHLKYPKTKCNKTLQLLHVVAHKEWGVDRKTLLLLYRSLVCTLLNGIKYCYLIILFAPS